MKAIVLFVCLLFVSALGCSTPEALDDELPPYGRLGGDFCTSSLQCKYRCCSPVDWSSPEGPMACLDPFENGTSIRVCLHVVAALDVSR